MQPQDAMRGYDFDLPLMDVLNDPETSPDRRVLAGATIGVGLDVAYLATCELAEAFEALAGDVTNSSSDGEGHKDLEEILSAGNPFQMRLWYLLYDTPFERAHADLVWLKSLTYRRARMCRVMQEQKLPVIYATNADLAESATAAELLANLSIER